MSEGASPDAGHGGSVGSGRGRPAEVRDVPEYDPEGELTVSCGSFERMVGAYTAARAVKGRLPEGLSDAQIKTVTRLRRFCEAPHEECAVNERRDECLLRRKDRTIWTFESEEHAMSALLGVPIRRTEWHRDKRHDGVNPPAAWVPLPDEDVAGGDDGGGRRPGPPVAVVEADAGREALDRYRATAAFEHELEQAITALDRLGPARTTAQQQARQLARWVLEQVLEDPSNDWMDRRSDEVRDEIARIDPLANGNVAAARQRQRRHRARARGVLAEIGLPAGVVEEMLPVERNMARGAR